MSRYNGNGIPDASMRPSFLLSALLLLIQPAFAQVEEVRLPFKLNVTRSAAIGETQLQTQSGAADKETRPNWIPAGAFTNDDMIAYYGVKMFGLKYSWRLPTQRITAKLDKDISMYWLGYRPDKCKIRIEPDDSAPGGNFKFHTLGDPAGPRGWLQSTGIKDETGWQYRYWFDQPH
jgi:hypothetical protein